MIGKWSGDQMKTRIGKGSKIYLDELNGWIYGEDEPPPNDRPVWVITEHQRRCIMECGVFVKWSVLDQKRLFWHPMEVIDEQEPPDFPTNFRVENDPHGEWVQV